MKNTPLWIVIALIVLVILCLVVVCALVVILFLPTQTATAPDLSSPVLVAPTTQTLGASPVLYLAGRSDIRIPALDETSEVSLFSCRGTIVQEVYPPGYRIGAGAEFTFRAEGRINYYGGLPEDGYPPDGDPNGQDAEVGSFDGISAYRGPAGGLAGVFLDDNIPTGTAPEPLDFTATGLGKDFARLQPGIGQVFFIGDGSTTSGQSQTFVAPTGATRLYLGLVDSASFVGAPSCYSDNTGSFTYQITSNQSYQPVGP